MTILTNKTILITGSTGGFGQEFAKQLFQKGNRLILTDLNEETLREQAQALDPDGSSGRIVAVVSSDLSSAEGATQLFEEVQGLDVSVDIDAPVAIDVLINNAGLAVFGRHDEVPPEAWERLMQVNLLAPMRLCALFVPQMIERRSGHIINISSMAGWIGADGLGAYCASKFGLRGFSETLAVDLRKYGVQVSAVYPYFSRTPILDSPRYGSLAAANPEGGMSEQGITDPADVVAEVITNVEQDTLHIFPDKMGRLIHRLNRYAPWLLRILAQRFNKVND